MKAKLGVAGLLAALVVAGMPGVSAAGWGSALTCGYHTAYAPDAVSAAAQVKEVGEAGGDSVFKLTCHSCGHCGYGSYYPAYSYYPSYSSYLSVSYSCGCSAWSPCGCTPVCGCCSGW
jgi:hypothetical protein